MRTKFITTKISSDTLAKAKRLAAAVPTQQVAVIDVAVDHLSKLSPDQILKLIRKRSIGRMAS